MMQLRTTQMNSFITTVYKCGYIHQKTDGGTIVIDVQYGDVFRTVVSIHSAKILISNYEKGLKIL